MLLQRGEHVETRLAKFHIRPGPTDRQETIHD
jgi:hypothetical protein